MHILIVDDEALARRRLLDLLADCRESVAHTWEQAASATEALQALKRQAFDVILLDIAMPEMDGLTLAQTLAQWPRPPAVVFVSAHSKHAAQAFELEAVDYLTKPVRLERLQQTLRKVERIKQSAQGLQASLADEFLLIQDRGQAERVALADVLYLKAELKYITVCTARRQYILDGSLGDLEQRYSTHLVRIHRNTLVARWAMQALIRHHDAQEGEGWALRLQGLDQLLAVSRRQLGVVRQALAS